MGPRFGPMSGQEMVYMVLKGRILKSDLKIEVLVQQTGWRSAVTNFTKNGNVIYFLMPAYPHPYAETIQASIVVYYKGEELCQNTYLYKQSLDRELRLRIRVMTRAFRLRRSIGRTQFERARCRITNSDVSEGRKSIQRIRAAQQY